MVSRLCNIFDCYDCSSRKNNFKTYSTSYSNTYKSIIILKQCVVCNIYNKRESMEMLNENNYMCKKCNNELINTLRNGEEYTEQDKKNKYNY